MSMTVALILSCEHAGKGVPSAYAHLFRGHEALLDTHRGYDIGALELATTLADQLKVPLQQADTTRLIVDLNRSSHSKTLFSEFTAPLAEIDTAKILETYYHPHRRRLEALLRERLLSVDQVIHLGIHTFTPVLQGKIRQTDIGLLYHPSYRLEKLFCLTFMKHLREAFPRLRTRRNYPYRGDSDSFPSYLRRIFPKDRYLGLQLEVNQRIPLSGGAEWSTIRSTLGLSLERALTDWLESGVCF